VTGSYDMAFQAILVLYFVAALSLALYRQPKKAAS